MALLNLASLLNMLIQGQGQGQVGQTQTGLGGFLGQQPTTGMAGTPTPMMAAAQMVAPQMSFAPQMPGPLSGPGRVRTRQSANPRSSGSTRTKTPRSTATSPYELPITTWANGGIAGLGGPEIGVLGEQGPEAVVPLGGSMGGTGGGNQLLQLLPLLIKILMMKQGNMSQGGGSPLLQYLGA